MASAFDSVIAFGLRGKKMPCYDPKTVLNAKKGCGSPFLKKVKKNRKTNLFYLQNHCHGHASHRGSAGGTSLNAKAAKADYAMKIMKRFFKRITG